MDFSKWLDWMLGFSLKNKEKSPVDCSFLQKFSVYCFWIFILSEAFNIIIVLIIWFRKSYLETSEYFRVAFMICNSLGAFIELLLMTSTFCIFCTSSYKCTYSTLVFMTFLSKTMGSEMYSLTEMNVAYKEKF